MAETKPPENESENDAADAEKTYWTTFEDKLKGIVNGIIDERMETIRTASTTRGNGRTTVPGLIANFMFGPEKKS